MLADPELSESDSESEEDEDELSDDESESEKVVAFIESRSLVTERVADDAATESAVGPVAPKSYSSMNFCRSVKGTTERSVGIKEACVSLPAFIPWLVWLSLPAEILSIAFDSCDEATGLLC